MDNLDDTIDLLRTLKSHTDNIIAGEDIPSESIEDIKISNRCEANIQWLLSDVSSSVPFAFIKWYSGMEKKKILAAYKRWLLEKE